MPDWYRAPLCKGDWSIERGAAAATAVCRKPAPAVELIEKKMIEKNAPIISSHQSSSPAIISDSHQPSTFGINLVGRALHVSQGRRGPKLRPLGYGHATVGFQHYGPGVLQP